MRKKAKKCCEKAKKCCEKAKKRIDNREILAIMKIELVEKTQQRKPKGGKKMNYMDYSDLKGRIRAKYKTQEAFAKAMDMSHSTLSKKLNNRAQWTCPEVMKACELLGISLADAHLYFFCTVC